MDEVVLPFGFPSAAGFWSTFPFFPSLHLLVQTGLKLMKAIMSLAGGRSPTSITPQPSLAPVPADMTC